MTEDEQNEAMHVLFSTIASQAMDTILHMFQPGAKIAMVVAFPDDPDTVLFTGTLQVAEAADALTSLSKRNDIPEKSFWSRSDGGIVEMDPLKPTDIN